MPGLVSVAFSPDGEILHVGSEADSIEAAKEVSGAVLIDPKISNVRSNPVAMEERVSYAKMADLAFRNCGIPEISLEEVENMSIKEAYKRVSPYFLKMKWFVKFVKEPKARWHKGVESAKNLSPTQLMDSILTTNYKTDKRIEGMDKVEVMGLSLLPHALIADVVNQKNFAEYKNDLGKDVLSPHFKPTGFCQGSNDMCRATCLVYSGHNWMVFYNAKLKAAKTLALLNEPVAFMKFVFESCKRLARSKAAYHFIRLNVLSDIPWERVAPWLFDEVRNREGKKIKFYDYTKVAGRVVPENYDLTFSFSGTNEALCRKELERGRRIAVVFLGIRKMTYGKTKGQWEAFRGLKGKDLIAAFKTLPTHFWGYPVIDGDLSDLRALDPGRVIVGLRFKAPHVGASEKMDISAREFGFAVKAYVVSDREASYSHPGTNPGGDGVEYLVAAQTPRYLDSHDDLDDDEEGEIQLEDRIEETDGEIDITPSGQLGMAP